MFNITEKSGFRSGSFDSLGPGVLNSFSLKNSVSDPVNFALHTGDDPAKVVLSRKAFLSSLGADPDRLSVVNQVHGDHVAIVTAREAGRGALDHKLTVEADALLTSVPGIPLMIFTADCLPVFLFDPVTKTAGLVHAGWQGAYKKIVSKTIRTAADRFGVKPGNLRVGLGPRIMPCCYETGPEFLARFDGKFFTNVKFFDLAGPVRDELIESGVPAGQIDDCRLCTCSSPDLCHSYRRDKTVFRHAAMMMIG